MVWRLPDEKPAAVTIADALTWEVAAEPPGQEQLSQGGWRKSLQAKWGSETDPTRSQCPEGPGRPQPTPMVSGDRHLIGSVNTVLFLIQEAREKSLLVTRPGLR